MLTRLGVDLLLVLLLVLALILVNFALIFFSGR